MCTGQEAAGVGHGYRIRHQDQVVPITNDFTIGRASTCQLRLSGALVSREHARFVIRRDELMIEDLGSRNGVLVNDVRVRCKTRLNHGDTVTIGLQTVEIIDQTLADRPENLSTLPPASPPPPSGEGADDETKIVQLATLSKREREVLELIAQGHTQREIASKLHVSIKTVESHRAHIGDKLGCNTRAELVKLAILSGMLRNR